MNFFAMNSFAVESALFGRVTFETVDSSHEKEMGTYAVHACHDKKPVVDTKEKCLSR